MICEGLADWDFFPAGWYPRSSGRRLDKSLWQTMRRDGRPRRARVDFGGLRSRGGQILLVLKEAAYLLQGE